MSQTQTTIRFNENGFIREIMAQVKTLRREQTIEVLYTYEGHRIVVDNLISVGSFIWH